MKKSQPLKIFVCLMQLAFLFNGTSQALAENPRQVSFNWRLSENPCPSSIEGYWGKTGDRVYVISSSPEDFKTISEDALVVEVPPLEEFPRQGPCIIPLTLELPESEATLLEKANSSKEEIVLYIRSIGEADPCKLEPGAEAACERGEGAFCYRLGLCHIKKGDRPAAKALFQKACNHSDPRGCIKLGKLLGQFSHTN